MQSKSIEKTALERIKKLLSETYFGDQERIYKLNLVTEKSTPTELIYNIERHLQQRIYEIDTIGSVSISTIDSTKYRRILHVTGIIAGGHLGHYPLEKQHIIVKSSFNKLSLDGKSDKVVEVLRQQLSLDVQSVRLISGDILGCHRIHNPYNSENCITTIKYHHIEGDIVALSYPTAKLKQESKEEQRRQLKEQLQQLKEVEKELQRLRQLKEEQRRQLKEQLQHLKEVEKEATTNIKPKDYQSMVRMQQSLENTMEKPQID